MSRPPLHLFEALGVELEYMIVDAETLDVKPICDEVLKAVAGKIVDNVDRPGGVTWSNELVLHVLELKATRPLPTLKGAAAEFHKNVRAVNEVLATFGARLMPTAMHPWMDPRREMVLWPHEYHTVYETFHRLFDCRGHGWANLQSTHINLPFEGDAEFGALHAAIRFLLPILPALTASSPVVEYRTTGILDNRLEMYRANSTAIPSLSGRVIPEPVYTKRDYEETILNRIYADVAPFDSEGVLRNEFLNARGAIARFSRGAIEIRLLDVQECPQADVAVCALVVATLRHLLADERLKAFPTETLHRLLLACIRDGERATIDDPEYAELLGLGHRAGQTVARAWSHLFHLVGGRLDEVERSVVEELLTAGPLARRILQAVGEPVRPAALRATYRELCDCLQDGKLFRSG